MSSKYSKVPHNTRYDYKTACKWRKIVASKSEDIQLKKYDWKKFRTSPVGNPDRNISTSD